MRLNRMLMMENEGSSYLHSIRLMGSTAFTFGPGLRNLRIFTVNFSSCLAQTCKSVHSDIANKFD